MMALLGYFQRRLIRCRFKCALSATTRYGEHRNCSRLLGVECLSQGALNLAISAHLSGSRLSVRAALFLSKSNFFKSFTKAAFRMTRSSSWARKIETDEPLPLVWATEKTIQFPRCLLTRSPSEQACAHVPKNQTLGLTTAISVQPGRTQ